MELGSLESALVCAQKSNGVQSFHFVSELQNYPGEGRPQILIREHRRTGPFFSRGGGCAIFARNFFSTLPEKLLCYANLQNYFARLTTPNNNV